MNKSTKIKWILALFIIGLAPLIMNGQSISEELAAIADIVVDQNGSGDFTTVQEGINSIPDNSTDTTIILVKKGVYAEKVILNHKKWNVILVGEDVDSTMITWDDWGDKMLVNGDPAVGGHTFSTYTFRADPHGFQAYNINFDNPTTRGQGVAFHSNGDKQIIYHCRITGNQDTYFDNFRTRRLIKDCFVAGGTDFIFGFGVTLFDSCQIQSVNSGYITASSTPQHYKFGHVFKDCRITGVPDLGGISLGRPWFPYSNAVFYECWLTGGIKKTGWDKWSGREETCFYREYNNYGPGADTTSRISFGKQLDPSLAPNYTQANILSASVFPSDLGVEVDTAELFSMRRRFTNSGYTARADTILYAGRDTFPDYPTDDWTPDYNVKVRSIIDKYTVPFIDPSNSNISVTKVQIGDKELDGFSTDITNYVKELGESVKEVPAIIIDGEGIEKLTIDYPDELPGSAKITTIAKDKSTGSVFTIFLSVDSAYWSTVFHQFIFNREDTVNVVAGKYEYDVILPDGDTKIRSLRINPKYDGQKYDKGDYPDAFPGIQTVDVTSVSQEETATYTFTVSLFTSIADLARNLYEIQVVNPVKNAFQLMHNAPVSLNIEIAVYDMSGKEILSGFSKSVSAGNVNDILDVTLLPNGLYLYSLRVNGMTYNNKFLKTE